jgi:hypothetical protein
MIVVVIVVIVVLPVIVPRLGFDPIVFVCGGLAQYHLCLLLQTNKKRYTCLSPQCSPNNSDNEEEDKEEEEGNSIIFEEVGTNGLVFGHNNSDNECED